MQLNCIRCIHGMISNAHTNIHKYVQQNICQRSLQTCNVLMQRMDILCACARVCVCARVFELQRHNPT